MPIWLGVPCSIMPHSPNDSRSLTVLAALVRLGIVTPDSDPRTASSVCVHVVGADVHEGRTAAHTVAVFAALVHALRGRVPELILCLVGPNVAVPDGTDVTVGSGWPAPPTPGSAAAAAVEAELPGAGAAASVDAAFQVRIVSRHGVLHEVREGSLPAADMVALLQGGLWGYDTWRPTLVTLARSGTPCLLTSYNEEEAGDDWEVVHEVCLASEVEVAAVVGAAGDGGGGG